METRLFGHLALAVSAALLAWGAEGAKAQAVLEGIPPVREEAVDDEAGWRATTLLAATVATSTAPEEDSGRVQDIVIGPEARVVAVLVESGANLGIGEMTFSIPWNEVVFSSDLSRLIVDRDQVALAPYSPHGPMDELDHAEAGQVLRFEGGELKIGSGLHKVSDLLAGLSGRASGDAIPGVIADLLIDPEGVVRGVVVAPPGTEPPHRRREPFFGLFDRKG